MDLVPAEKEVEILLEAPAVFASGGSAGQRHQPGHQLVERVGRPLRHLGCLTRTEDQAFFAARTGAFSGLLCSRSMYFC